MVDRNDTDKIIVEDGHIYIKIMPNTASTTEKRYRVSDNNYAR